MPGLNESLGRVLDIEGVRAAALIDAGTGMLVGSAGLPGAVPGARPAGDPGAVYAALAEEYRVASAALGPACPGGDLEQVTVLTAGAFQLLRVLDARPGEGTLLCVDVDRERTNLALADLQIGRAAAAILA